MRIIVPACLLLACVLAAARVHADICSEVAADTVAELRAGATDWWSDEIEGLVRAAAGSACVKVTSGRYATTRPEPPAADAVAADPDDESLSLGGLSFRGMSGSPGRKPYERQRDRNREAERTDEDAEER